MSELADTRQLKRINFIDLCAYVLGYVNRPLLMNRFDIKDALAAKDFSAYRAMAGDRLIYDPSLRAYKPTDWFSPLFEHKVSDALQLLSHGSQNIICEQRFAMQAYSYAIASTEPNLENIHCVLRALHLNKKVEINYISRSSGEQSRLIAPHTLIRTGCFQYIRGYDHKSGEFRNFKLNRIRSSNFINASVSNDQVKEVDVDWNTIVRLTIISNKALTNREAIEYDFGLTDGTLTVDIKKAMIHYFLMDWSIAPLEYTDLPPTLFPLQLYSMSEIP